MRVNFEAEHDAMSDAARAWWLLVVVGVASLVAGVILVTKPSNSLATLAVIVGIFLLIDGIVELVASFGRPAEGRTIAVIVGLLGVIIGILLIRHPTHAVTAIGLLIGIWLVAAGVLRLLQGDRLRRPNPASGVDRGGRGLGRDRDRVRPAHRVCHAGRADRDLADRQRDRDDRTGAGGAQGVRGFAVTPACGVTVSPAITEPITAPATTSPG